MENYITEDTLREVGVNLQGQDVVALLAHLNEMLEERVGTEITDALDDDKLQTLLDLQETASDEEVGNWMKANVPDFEAIVQDEIDILLGELAENADGINTTA
jgi:hypothetical protein